MADEFHADERIAGFPLVSIQKALVWVGVMDDRDDLKSVCDALGCGPRQAARVLDELERCGLVTKGKGNRWAKTQKGHRLAFDWKPPRRFQPMIERDDKNSPTNECLEDVPCLLFGSQDDEDVFEEARLHVLFWTEFEGKHLVEVSVFEPDDYDNPESGGTSTRSAYLTAADARTLAAGLQKAADMAEAEVARRAKHPPKRHPVPKKTKMNEIEGSKDDKSIATTVAAAEKAARTAAAARRATKDAVAATLAELRGAEAPPPRRPPKKT